MGLDTTHDAWHGSYGAFHRWRLELARVAGIPLELMEGFYSDDDIGGLGLGIVAELLKPTPFSFLADSLGKYSSLLPLSWDVLKPDSALHFLLHHSDCDGDIPLEMLEPLAQRLEELLPLLEGDGGGHIGNYQEKTQKFIDGLRLAHSLGEPVEFL